MDLVGFVKVHEVDADCTFFFDGEKLRLIKTKSISGIDKGVYLFTLSPTKISVLSARTSMGGDVYFFDVLLYQNGITVNEYVGYCSSYIYPTTQNNFYTHFRSIALHGNVINMFYPPINCIESNSFIKDDINPRKYLGKKIVLRKYDDYTIKRSLLVKNIELNIVVSVDIPGSHNLDSTDLGKIQSYFRIDFSENIPIKDVPDWYGIFKKLFQFMFNRQSISFDQIYISNIMIDGRISKLGLYTLCGQEPLNEIPKESKKCVKCDLFNANFQELVNVMADGNINTYHLPRTNDEHRVVSPEKYVFTASIFEYEYDLIHKDEELLDENLQEVKTRVYEVLDEIDKANKGINSRIRSTTKNVKHAIEKMSSSLESKFSNEFRLYKSDLEDIILAVEKAYSVKIDNIDIGHTFAKARNNNAHGTIVHYTDEETVAFILGRALVYAMILERCKFNKSITKKILNLHYIP
jgi:hypothetical protein